MVKLGVFGLSCVLIACLLHAGRLWGVVLQWKAIHWCCAFTTLLGPHMSADIYGPVAFDPHAALLMRLCPDDTIKADVTLTSHTSTLHQSRTPPSPIVGSYHVDLLVPCPTGPADPCCLCKWVFFVLVNDTTS